MTGIAKLHKVGINLNGNDLILPKLTTTTLNSSGELGFNGTYLKFFSGLVERGIGGSGTNDLRLDEINKPTTPVSFGLQNIVDVLDPVNPQDVATKAYVDAVSQGLHVKASVRAGTISNLSVTRSGNILTSNSNGILISDGITMSVFDRLLVKNQIIDSYNGIFDVTSTGDSTHPFILTRSSDADNNPSSNEVTTGLFTFIMEGNILQNTGWVLTTTGTITLGTTSLTFSQFSGAGQLIGGNGLVKTGNTLDVVSGNRGIVVSSDSLSLGLAPMSGLIISTGLSIDTSIVAKKYIDESILNGDGIKSSFIIRHNLGNQWVLVDVIDKVSQTDIVCDIERTDINTVTIGFSQPLAINESYAVIIIG